MSSNSTISAIDGKKLVVHLSENGHSFEFECGGSTPVDAIQRSIESLSGISTADQLLMCGKFALEPHQQLAYYKLPNDGCEVFLYNKSKLLAESPRPAPETLEIPNAVVPSLLLQSPHPLDEATDPAMKALALYEKQFRYHFQYGNAFYVTAQTKFEICKRLLREQQVQGRALDTARGNMEHTFKRLHQRYSEFIRYFLQQHRVHGEMLGNFERDVERLRSLRFHPAIQREGRKFLLDIVNESELRKWADTCLNSHRQFESKVSQLKMSFVDLKKKVENVFSEMSSCNVEDFDIMIRDHQKDLNEQKSVMQSLSKDVDTVKKLVDDYSSSQLSGSTRPHEAVSALGPMYDAHENYLPKVQNCDNLLTKLLEKCMGKKDDMNYLVHVSMQKVKSAQSSIKDMMHQLHAFQEVMVHQEKEFENLKFVCGIGHAYRACLAEVARRKSSLKLYMGLAGQLAERIATEREAEISRREGFLKQWSRYMPNDILHTMGLFDSPSQCDVNMAPFDTKLLEIDVADVDRYAPQFVLGLPSRSEKNRLPKSNLAISSDSSSSKSEENPYNIHLKCDTEGFVEGFEQGDITGTSKMEVENARMKAELASAIAIICTYNADAMYGPFDKVEPDDMLKAVREKTIEALESKDEYIKHIESLLNMKQVQCSSYEKRIQELEQRLEEQYVQDQKASTKTASGSALTTEGFREDMFGERESRLPYVSTVSMDDMSSTSASVNTQSMDSVRISLDASMQETSRHEHHVGDSDDRETVGIDKNQTEELDREVKMTTVAHDSSTSRYAFNNSPCGVTAELSMDSVTRDGVFKDLQSALSDKSDQCIEGENKLIIVMEEIASLRRELEVSCKLLSESQMKCVHLENCLHQEREKACTNLRLADRKSSQYEALRKAAVGMCSLFERFHSCVTAEASVDNFAEKLSSFSLSLASSAKDDDDDATVKFRESIKVVADQVSMLTLHRLELLERCSWSEATPDEKTEQIKSLYTKLQLEKQARDEKISFVHLEVHDLACFVLNAAGHYEVVHRNYSNYFLSAESVALFASHCSGKRTFIIGQIVHIERRIATDSADASNPEGVSSVSVSNPYSLPAGCEYFVVTITMLPDTVHSAPS